MIVDVYVDGEPLSKKIKIDDKLCKLLLARGHNIRREESVLL